MIKMFITQEAGITSDLTPKKERNQAEPSTIQNMRDMINIRYMLTTRIRSMAMEKEDGEMKNMTRLLNTIPPAKQPCCLKRQKE